MNLFECISLMHRMGAMDDPTYYRALHKKNILTEADSRLKKVIAIIRKYFPSEHNLEGRVSSEEYYVDNNPHTTWEQYFLYKLRHDFGLMSNADVALLPAVAEIAFGECHFGFDNCDDMKVERLKKYVSLLKEDKPFLDTFKQGGVTFKQLEERYGAVLDGKTHAEQEKMNKTEYIRNDNYTIIPLSTMTEAYEYGKDSGINGEGPLCFTTHKSMWASFTKDGKNKCYCVLRNDYKDVPCEKSEGYPKDNYGLSMIFVFVSPLGQLTNSNVRWNHGYRDFINVDNMFSKSEISDIIGQRFDEAFNCEDGARRFEEEALQKGKRNGIVLSYDGKYYLLDGNGHLKRNKDGDLLMFDYVGNFNEGFAGVELNGKWNFIDKDCKYLSEQWFDYAYDFYNGFAIVCLNGKYNFINREGNYIGKQWFDDAYDFHEGFARVYLNNKWNFIDKDCHYLSEQWFDDAESFIEGLAWVRLKGKYNFINREGNLLSKQWFEGVGNFREGFACVRLNGKWNFIDRDCNYIGTQWFDDAYNFNEGFARVSLDNMWNFIDTEGNYLSKQWFYGVGDFGKGFAWVELHGEQYKIDKDGNLHNY